LRKRGINTSSFFRLNGVITEEKLVYGRCKETTLYDYILEGIMKKTTSNLNLDFDSLDPDFRKKLAEVSQVNRGTWDNMIASEKQQHVQAVRAENLQWFTGAGFNPRFL